MQVKTNNQPRDIVYGFELSDNILSEFDYWTMTNAQTLSLLSTRVNGTT